MTWPKVEVKSSLLYDLSIMIPFSSWLRLNVGGGDFQNVTGRQGGDQFSVLIVPHWHPWDVLDFEQSSVAGL
jgi:hypothetical protein